MRSKKQAIVECVGSWAMLQYFPGERDARTAIMRIIDAMATTAEQVDWLAAEMITRFNEWPGPQALRALFCTRFRPADGKEENFPQNHRISQEAEARAIEQSDGFKRLDAAKPMNVRLLASGENKGEKP
jgi:hypothetical protein